MKKTLAFLGFLAFAACSSSNLPITPVPAPDVDKCAAGCARLKWLGCPEAQGSDSTDPNSCTKDCQYVESQGLRINPTCWETMRSCADLDTTCK